MRPVKGSQQPQLEFKFARRMPGATSGMQKPKRIPKNKRKYYTRQMEEYISSLLDSENPQKRPIDRQLRFTFADIKQFPKGIKPLSEISIEEAHMDKRDFAKVKIGKENYFFLPKGLNELYKRDIVRDIATLFDEVNALVAEGKIDVGHVAKDSIPPVLHAVEPRVLELSQKKLPSLTRNEQKTLQIANAFLRRALPLPRKSWRGQYPAGAR
ncbi:MAG: hypothetical protein HYW05_01255 [Candidatus Diapherotrites archaeon]|nr:hypothetical protein [Candidatus Diapherotrites archaeon]